MIAIVFEAHATTPDNEQKKASGHNDVELSPLGEEQARELGARWIDTHFDAVFCSDLSRAYRTAEIAFDGRNIPIIKDARLRECDYGDWTGRPSKEVEEERPNRITDPFPGGECYADTSFRVLSFLNEISQTHDGKTVMIIGHRATQYGLERWINAVPLKVSVSTHWVWQPGWTYHLWKKVSIPTSRGVMLSGHLYARDPKKIVISAHGFGSDQFGKSTLLAQTLAQNNISALTFDFSGCGESDNDTVSVTKEVQDLRSAIEYVRSLGYTAIGIEGSSAGGLIALRVWDPDIKTLVLWAPVTHRWDAEEKYSPDELAEFEREGHLTIQKMQPYLRSSVVLDKEVLRERTEINTKELLSRITCPVLIIHGSDDTDVPIIYSKEAMPYLSGKSRLEILEGENHFFNNSLETLMKLSGQWFSDRL